MIIRFVFEFYLITQFFFKPFQRVKFVHHPGGNINCFFFILKYVTLFCWQVVLFFVTRVFYQIDNCQWEIKKSNFSFLFI